MFTTLVGRYFAAVLVFSASLNDCSFGAVAVAVFTGFEVVVVPVAETWSSV